MGQNNKEPSKSVRETKEEAELFKKISDGFIYCIFYFHLLVQNEVAALEGKSRSGII